MIFPLQRPQFQVDDSTWSYAINSFASTNQVILLLRIPMSSAVISKRPSIAKRTSFRK